MPTLSWGVQWSTCLSGLRRATSVLQFLPLLHRRLLLGTSCAHAHFISGHPVEYLSVWPPSCDFFVGAFFRIYFLKPRYPVVLGPGFLQEAVYLCLHCWPF